LFLRNGQKNLIQRIPSLFPGRLRGTSFGYEIDIPGAHQPLPVVPEKLAAHPFNPVPDNRRADFFRNSYTHPCPLRTAFRKKT
jgi:hypothetical protein